MKNSCIRFFAIAVSATAFSLAGAATIDSRSPVLKANTYLDIARAGDRVVAVGDRGLIVYSDDDGHTWRRANSPTRVLLTAVCFADANHGWAVGHDAVVVGTRDGGASWQVQYSDVLSVDRTAADLDDDFADDDYGYDDFDDYADDDFADDGSAGGQDTSGAPLLDVVCLNKNRAIAVGGYGYMVETVNGGADWAKVTDRLENSDGWHLNAITQLPGNNTMLAVGEKGSMFRSRDNGLSWRSLKSPYEGSFFGATALADGTVMVYGLQGNLWVSRDQGDSWRQVQTGVTRGINSGAVLKDGTVVLVGGAGVVLVSRDGGNSVTLQYLRDRESVSAVLPLANGNLLMVGDAGIRTHKDIR
jgi:photosystem II stability/assembly factor-like uncharacterized protein